MRRNPHIRLETDRISGRRVFGILALATAVSGFFTWWAVYLEESETAELGAARGQPSVAPAELSGVLQTPIETARSGQEEQRRWLEGWGWIDREAGIVRLPIEEAMQVVVEQGAPP